MSRSLPIILIAMLACSVTVADAQDWWRSNQPPVFAQSGQNPGQTNRQPAVPGPAAGQNYPDQAQYSYVGNYDLPPQTKANNQNNRQQLQITRQTQIPLPFKITQANQDKLSSVELVYSMDQGQNWYSYQHLPSTETKFDFNVPGDGEYWFVFYAIFKNGEIMQIGPTPAARVLVDRVPPKLALNARRSSSGEVTVEWTAEDAALKNTPPTISLSYDSNATWMTLAVDRKNVKREGNRETGYVTFWPLHEAEAVEIRCELEDAAENREIQTTRLVLKLLQNGNTPDMATMPAIDADDAPPTVQPVPDVSVLPPRPIVLANTQQTQYINTDNAINSTATNSTAPQDDSLLNMLKTLGEPVPSAVSADVTQPYANNFDDSATASTAQSSPPAPSMLSSIPATQFLPGNTPNNTNTVVTVASSIPQLPEPDAEPTVGNGIVVTSETEDFPGKIMGVWHGHDENQPLNNQQYIIVRWMPGGPPFTESKVDLYRSETKHGPWRPIAFDLKNAGQHYWPVSIPDQMPFYLRVDMRTTQGAFTDFTVQAIALPLSLNAPPPNPVTQEDTAVIPGTDVEIQTEREPETTPNLAVRQ